jgi:alkylation response protein AidB-like acyl-CoA dehydrogenase
MNLDFSDDQKLLKETARDFLNEHSPLSVCRRILDSESEPYAAELWSQLGEMGWLGTTIPEAYGGAGFGDVELALLCEELGRALAPVPFGPSVTVAAEAILCAASEEQKQRFLPAMAAGDRIGTLAVAEQMGPLRQESIATKLEGDRVFGTKLAVPDATCADFSLVLAQGGDGLTMVLVDLDSPEVKREPVASLDPSRPLSRIDFGGVTGEVLGEPGSGWKLFETLRLRAAVLQAFEQIGGAEHALELTRDFTLERFAFGRPVGSYQALKHRMVDVFTAIELARSHAYYAAWALSTDAPELLEAACSARISACAAFEAATTEMIQLHGGVGFTWEYDCHLFYRRAKGLSASLGSPQEWKRRLTAAISG